MSETPVLYSYWRSSCSWRVRIALELKEIKYEYRAIDLVKGEQNNEQFLKINPLGYVPAFVHNGNAISQSLAIIEYLDEVYPDKFPLISGSAAQKALIRSMALMIIADIQPLQNVSPLKFYGGSDEQKRNEWADNFISRGFKALEKQLERTAGKYAIGDKLTLVDLCIPPQVFNAKRYNVDLTPFPIIRRITETLTDLEAFKRADAANQPDTPSK
ncbi:Maleylacetoacetate isomerase [Aphelenchoides besseyi]|nr:Maleylacetoacetate isomerase [Aphelenchoides besseyi]